MAAGNRRSCLERARITGGCLGDTIAALDMGGGYWLFYFSFFVLPGLLIAFLGWWLSSSVKNRPARIAIRAGLISIAVTPIPYGHAGYFPAIVAVLSPPVAGVTDWGAISALSTVWLVTALVLLRTT